MSPMQSSLTTNPQSKVFEGVLSDGFLQITATLIVFPATAKGNKEIQSIQSISKYDLRNKEIQSISKYVQLSKFITKIVLISTLATAERPGRL